MAAGAGERFGDEPKPFARLHGRPMLVWSLERFAAHDGIDSITVVVAAGLVDRARGLIAELSIAKVDGVIVGGATRQVSVRLGLESLDPSCDRVLVHDAARPCITNALITLLLDSLDNFDAVVPIVPTVDALVHLEDGKVGAIVDRTNVAGVQTPQAFRTELVNRAHERAESTGFTAGDDGSLVLALGEEVRTIPGERTNIKVTFEEDIAIAKAMLQLQGEGA